MIDLFATYLFLCGAVIMLIIAIWSKLAWVAGISAAGWFASGIYFMVVAMGNYFVDALGIFCVFAGVGAAALPWILRPKKIVEPPITHDRTRDIDKKYREMTRRYKGDEE